MAAACQTEKWDLLFIDASFDACNSAQHPFGSGNTQLLKGNQSPLPAHLTAFDNTDHEFHQLNSKEKDDNLFTNT